MQLFVQNIFLKLLVLVIMHTIREICNLSIKSIFGIVMYYNCDNSYILILYFNL